jgi:hypothetical protein
MPSITFSELLTIIYVLVDDWYQMHGIKFLNGKANIFRQRSHDAGDGT